MPSTILRAGAPRYGSCPHRAGIFGLYIFHFLLWLYHSQIMISSWGLTPALQPSLSTWVAHHQLKCTTTQLNFSYHPPPALYIPILANDITTYQSPSPKLPWQQNGSYLLNMFQAHMLSYLTITTKLWGELHYRWEKGSSEKLINLPKITRLESSITRTQIQVYFQWAAGFFFFFFSVSRAPWVFLRLFQGSVRWKLCSR